MAIDIKLVSELRARTGAGLMDAKKALEQTNGNIEAAIDALRKAGALKAAKKAAREAKEGVVESYIHANGKVGTMVVLNCETDFVARNDKFRELAKHICMHIAAADPEFLRVEDVPPAVIEKEMEIYKEQLKTQGKPANMLEKIAEGKLANFYAEKVLLKQLFVRDDSKTVEQLLAEAVTTLGEKIEISKMARFTV